MDSREVTIYTYENALLYKQGNEGNGINDINRTVHEILVPLYWA